MKDFLPYVVPTIYVLEQKLHDVLPCKPKFYFTNMGCKGVYNTWTLKHDEAQLPLLDVRLQVATNKDEGSNETVGF